MIISFYPAARGSKQNQLNNGITILSYKWFTLTENKLDGTYHLIPNPTGTYEVGVFSSCLSDTNGKFSSPPYIIYETGDIDIHGIRIVGDSKRNIYVTNIHLYLYKDGIEIFNNYYSNDQNQIDWHINFGKFYSVDKIKVEIHSINKANNAVVIAEMDYTNEPTSSDTLEINFSEDGKASLSITSEESVILQIDENRDLFNVSMDNEVLNIQLIHTKRVESTFSKNSGLEVTTNESSNLKVDINKTDIIRINKEVENDSVDAFINASESIDIQIIETPVMDNIHTVMNAPTRQVFAKVEVTYTNPQQDNTLEIETSRMNVLSRKEQLYDGLKKPKYKYFFLFQNKLDGTYHPIGENSEIGWLDEKLSDENGIVDPAAEITFRFKESRSIVQLEVVGNIQNNNFPVDFSIKLYDDNDNLLYTENVVGNTDVDWIKDISPVHDVAKLVLRVTKISTPHVVCNILEMYPVIVETYYSDKIIDIDLLEETAYETSTPLGGVSANELNITFNNEDRRFSPNNQQSILKSYLKKNRKVKVWFGAYVNGNLEWYPWGVYWSDSWDIKRRSMVAKLKALDLLDLLRKTNYSNSTLKINKTLTELATDILIDAGLKTGDFVIDSVCDSIIIPYSWFDRQSHREALQKLASCALVSMYCDHNGRIVIDNILNAKEYVTEFTEDSYIDVNYPQAYKSSYNYVEVEYINYALEERQEIYNEDMSEIIKPNTSKQFICRFNNIPCDEIQDPTIDGINLKVIETKKYAWGCIVTIKNIGSTDSILRNINIQGRPLKEQNRGVVVAKDENSVLIEGEIRAPKISSPFIQTREYAKYLAETLLRIYSNAKYDAQLNARGDIAVQLENQVKLIDSIEGINDYYKIIRQSVKWDGVFHSDITLKKVGD
ncbi:hypothetical protein SAMN02745883_00685 [Caminicella sporogenes DSM 14501]|uniref:Phage tail protein n=1 Tax=Caminicella sporogenes DSM 14501 TaxID=1121266 RepID=A0A1M6MXB0_9FIRM|nr:hypothetical protein [Caminicella sporogenes]RKD22460.1 hypothetical protein BET04_05355 [Caminicella sporogenes]SHJ88044.1 hypothetical protein SAMN02745883_00685 [Caminicella sporogenes DSM 14501]